VAPFFLDHPVYTSDALRTRPRRVSERTQQVADVRPTYPVLKSDAVYRIGNSAGQHDRTRRTTECDEVINLHGKT